MAKKRPAKRKPAKRKPVPGTVAESGDLKTPLSDPVAQLDLDTPEQAPSDPHGFERYRPTDAETDEPVRGRPRGSKTETLETTETVRSSCVRSGCHSTEFDVLKKLPDVRGNWTRPEPRNVMRRRRVRCQQCGQQRIAVEFLFVDD